MSVKTMQVLSDICLGECKQKLSAFRQLEDNAKFSDVNKQLSTH